MRDIIVKGNVISLSNHLKSDFGMVLKGLNDPINVSQYINRADKIFHEGSQDVYFDKVINDANRRSLSVVINELNIAIGIVNIRKIDWLSRNGEIAITIYDKKYHGQGYGTQAIALLIKYCFKILGLHKIYLYVNNDNEKANSVYKKNGFDLVGILKKHSYILGKWRDVSIYELVNSEYVE